jgi:hypothetical protein
LYFCYLWTAFEALLFRPHVVKTVFPMIPKLLRQLGLEGYIARDQTRVCTLSHPNQSCSENAKLLYRTWWKTIPPIMLLSTTLFSLARGARLDSVISARRFAEFFRSLVFFFGSTGVPGYVFCLSKNSWFNETGTGDRAGLTLATAVGTATSVAVMPTKSLVRVLNGLLTTSALALLLSLTRRCPADA